MNDKYLVINAGSSSLKISLYDSKTKQELINGYFEKIGSPDSFYTLKMKGSKVKISKPVNNHVEAVYTMLDEMIKNGCIKDINEIKGIGHRVLHGGEFYKESTFIDEEVKENLKSLIKLGP